MLDGFSLRRITKEIFVHEILKVNFQFLVKIEKISKVDQYFISLNKYPIFLDWAKRNQFVCPFQVLQQSAFCLSVQFWATLCKTTDLFYQIEHIFQHIHKILICLFFDHLLICSLLSALYTFGLTSETLFHLINSDLINFLDKFFNMEGNLSRAGFLVFIDLPLIFLFHFLFSSYLGWDILRWRLIILVIKIFIIYEL